MKDNRFDSKISSMRSCMEIAKYLDDSPQHLIPAPANATEADRLKLADRHRWSRKNVSHMLNAIVLEIAIKVTWELDNDKECRHTHNISKLYNELGEESRRELKRIYDEKFATISGLQGTNKNGQTVRIGDLVQLQSLQDALVANEDTMKNFKYDGDFNGKSSAMGSVIWSKDLLWIIPPLGHERIPEALYRYTMRRVQRANLG